MDLIRPVELRELALFHDGPCLSVYLPLHRNYQETGTDAISFRNLLDQAEQSLLDWPMRAAEVRKFLQCARELQADPDRWNPTGAAGLALFLAREFSRLSRQPYAVPESSDVGNGFYITPLVCSLQYAARFHLLAISPNQVRLFDGTPQGLAPVPLPASVPQSEADVDRKVEIEYETSMQYHTSSGFGAAGSLRGTPHGHGDPQDDRHEVFEDFLHAVVRKLIPRLIHDNQPLYLAATHDNHSIFRKVCRYPLLQNEGVFGSPDELSEQEMFEQVRPLATAFAQQRMMQRLAYYQKLRSGDQASDDIATIASSAWQGRVNTMFCRLGERRWGRFDATTERAEEHFQQEAGDVDLIDHAVKSCLTHGSDVVVVADETLPDDRPAVATFRW